MIDRNRIGIIAVALALLALALASSVETGTTTNTTGSDTTPHISGLMYNQSDSLNYSLTSNTSYFWGNSGYSIITNLGFRIYFLQNTNITGVNVFLRCSLAGSSENISFYIRKSNSDDVYIGNISSTSSYRYLENNSLNIIINKSDFITMKMVTPVFSTQPRSCFASGVLISSNGSAGGTGADGTDGADGAPGVNGINGTNGLDGVNGTNGTNGTNGINGTDGINQSDATKVNKSGDNMTGLLNIQQDINNVSIRTPYDTGANGKANYMSSNFDSRNFFIQQTFSNESTAMYNGFGAWKSGWNDSSKIIYPIKPNELIYAFFAGGYTGNPIAANISNTTYIPVTDMSGGVMGLLFYSGTTAWNNSNRPSKAILYSSKPSLGGLNMLILDESGNISMPNQLKVSGLAGVGDRSVCVHADGSFFAC